MSLDPRKCVNCGAQLTEEDVMKIISEDGNCEVFPLSTCPECFKKNLMKSKHQQE
jgi:DNA-directed RNA polymerase subunit RPC12/RpoP